LGTVSLSTRSQRLKDSDAQGQLKLTLASIMPLNENLNVSLESVFELTSNFDARWQDDPNRETTPQKVKSAFNPPGNLRKKLVETDRALQGQIGKLEKSLARMSQKEKSLFTKTSNAFQKHETAQANAYASELAEVRKAFKLVSGAKLALERVQGRLKTITDFGDLANALAPVGSVVRTVRQTLQAVMPGATDSFSAVSSTLDGLMQEIGSVPGFTMDSGATSEESEKIIAEASAIAEARMVSNLPSVPSTEVSEASGSDTTI